MTSWGQRIAGSLSLLAAGCAPAVEMAPAVPRPTTTLLADPPGAGPGLTPLRPLMAPAATEEVRAKSSKVVASGKGVLWYGDLFADGRCPVAGAEPGQHPEHSCWFLRTAPWVSPPSATSPGVAGAWSPLRAAPVGWSALSSGREAFHVVTDERKPSEKNYGQPEGFFVLHALDERGEARPLLSIPDEPGMMEVLDVVDLPRGLVLVVTAGGDHEIRLIPVRRKGEALTPQRTVRTGIATQLSLARYARMARQQGLLSGYGPHSVAPALDAKGEPDDSFFLAWTEAIPPPKNTPTGVAPARRRGRHECGRGSRSLSDLSVEKRVHVTRFSAAGHRVSDRIVDEASFDEEPPPGLALRPTAQGFVLNGVALGRDGRPLKEAPAAEITAPSPPPLTMPAEPRLETAAFDQRRGEGLALVSEAGRRRAVRFDALGEPVGTPVAVDRRAAVAPMAGSRLAAAGEAWGLLTDDAASIEILTGPLAGRAVPAAGGDVTMPAGPQAGRVVPLIDDDVASLTGEPCWLLPLDQDSVEVVCFARVPTAVRAVLGLGPDARAPLIRRVFLQGGGAGPWVLAPGWLDDEANQDLRVTWAGRGPRGQLELMVRQTGGYSVELRSLRGREWSAPVPLWEGMGQYTASVVPVWKDEAIMFEQKDRSVLHWPGQERRVIDRRTLGVEPARGKPSMRLPGPLLGAGDLVLAAGSPEPIAVERATPEPPGSCPASFATGPRRVVLLCLAAERGALGSRLGTRVLRF